jgi:hypothetical protein
MGPPAGETGAGPIAGSAGAGAGQAGTSAGGTGGSAGRGGAATANLCPGTEPAAGSACEGDRVCECPKSSPVPCGRRASCRAGTWITEYISDGFCNPAVCRYPRKGCFSYLDCAPVAGTGRWRATNIQGRALQDTCCPLTKPAVGTTCTAEQGGLLCGTWEDSVVCRDGMWSERTNPFHGVGGGGQGGH